MRQSWQVTIVESSSEEQSVVPREGLPDGTVYFSDGNFFQDFSGFQYQSFPMNNNQFSTEPPQEEHIFQTGFLGPQDSSSFL